MNQPLIAITGASGFVGRAVLREITRLGLGARVLMRRPAATGELEAVLGDVSDSEALARLCAGADAAIHIAGAIKAVNRAQFFAANAQGAANVAEAARKAGVGRFVHVSSLAAREPQLSAYAASKRQGEQAVADAAGPMKWVMLRPPAVYGPVDQATLPLFRQLTRPMAVLPADPQARVSLLHVDDLAASLVRAALQDEGMGLIHEIDDGRPGGYGWRDICDIAGRAEGRVVRPLFVPRVALFLPAVAAELMAAMSGRALMVNRGKLAELYHPDWVVRGASPPFHAPRLQFDRGFAETLAAYRQLGLLPEARPGSRNAGNDDGAKRP